MGKWEEKEKEDRYLRSALTFTSLFLKIKLELFAA